MWSPHPDPPLSSGCHPVSPVQGQHPGPPQPLRCHSINQEKDPRHPSPTADSATHQGTELGGGTQAPCQGPVPAPEVPATPVIHTPFFTESFLSGGYFFPSLKQKAKTPKTPSLVSLQVPGHFSSHPNPNSSPTATSADLTAVGLLPPRNRFPPGDLRDARSLASSQRLVFEWWQHNGGHLSPLESLLP